jgi:uncharacterized protein (DUF3820 family)
VSNQPLETLKDLDVMPFGQYYNSRTKMQDVPASYMHWLWTSGLKNELKARSKQGKVARYIEANMSALKQEHPDGIWE